MIRCQISSFRAGVAAALAVAASLSLADARRDSGPSHPRPKRKKFKPSHRRHGRRR